MLINSVNNISFMPVRKFDKTNVKQYNGCIQQDVFVSSFGKKKMADKSEKNSGLEQLKKSEKMQSSPVAYVVDLLDSILNDKITKQEFAKEMKEKTKEAQFFFFHMPEAHIKENQKVFSKEFILADEVYRVSKTARQADISDVKKGLEDSIEKYNS